MTILTLTKTGALRLPRELLKLLGNPKHLQVRVNATGITLSPVEIQPTMDKKAVPEAPQ
jgi:hypothetical protein